MSCLIHRVVSTDSLQICRGIPGFVHLALGDTMQKRNYYRAGWIKFTDDADMTAVIDRLGEVKVRVTLDSVCTIGTYTLDRLKVLSYMSHIAPALFLLVRGMHPNAPGGLIAWRKI